MVVIFFAAETIIIYTFFLVYPFWTSNRGYLVPSLKYIGFYIFFENDSFQLPEDEKNDDSGKGQQPPLAETLFANTKEA